jgi:hypothetical protein
MTDEQFIAEVARAIDLLERDKQKAAIASIRAKILIALRDSDRWSAASHFAHGIIGIKHFNLGIEVSQISPGTLPSRCYITIGCGAMIPLPDEFNPVFSDLYSLLTDRQRLLEAETGAKAAAEDASTFRDRFTKWVSGWHRSP